MDLCPVRLDESHWPRLEVRPVHTAISVSKHTHFLHLAYCVIVTSLHELALICRQDFGLYCLRVSLTVLSMTQGHFVA